MTPRLEGLFEVSNLGQIRDVRNGRIMKSVVNKNGYMYSIVSINKKLIRLAMHRVVCEAFHGPPPPRHDVNHKNFDRTCNHSDNLEWVTRSENLKYSYRLGNRIAVNNPEKISAAHKLRFLEHPEAFQIYGVAHRKLSEPQVREIKEALRSGGRGTVAELSRRYGVASRTIRDIRNGICWRFV